MRAEGAASGPLRAAPLSARPDEVARLAAALEPTRVLLVSDLVVTAEAAARRWRGAATAAEAGRRALSEQGGRRSRPVMARVLEELTRGAQEHAHELELLQGAAVQLEEAIGAAQDTLWEVAASDSPHVREQARMALDSFNEACRSVAEQVSGLFAGGDAVRSGASAGPGHVAATAPGVGSEAPATLGRVAGSGGPSTAGPLPAATRRAKRRVSVFLSTWREQPPSARAGRAFGSGAAMPPSTTSSRHPGTAGPSGGTDAGRPSAAPTGPFPLATVGRVAAGLLGGAGTRTPDSAPPTRRPELGPDHAEPSPGGPPDASWALPARGPTSPWLAGAAATGAVVALRAAGQGAAGAVPPLMPMTGARSENRAPRVLRVLRGEPEEWLVTGERL